MARHNQTGKWGEEIATEYLVTKGYDIVERNWRLEHLEIDIIARHKQRFAFVEVKTRTNMDDADPAKIITKRKLQNLVRSATAYMKNFSHNFDVQFDIIIISGTRDNFKLEHFPDAYFPPMKTYR